MESLCVPFACMEHGIKIDMFPTKYGGLGGMTVDGDFISSAGILSVSNTNEEIIYSLQEEQKIKIGQWISGKIMTN